MSEKLYNSKGAVIGVYHKRTDNLFPKIKHVQIALWGNGQRKQNYIHVKDAASYLISSSKTDLKNECFLAVSSKSISNKEVAEYINYLLNDITIVFKSMDNSNSYVFDNDFSRKELGINRESDVKEELSILING